MWSSLNPLPHLPSYTGPYKVGSAEYEIPISELPSSTKIPDDSINTIKFRIFYPSSNTSSSKKSISWLPSPQKEWNRAYAKFLGMTDRSSGFMANLPSLLNYASIPAVQNASILERPDGKQWLVVIFSHGLGGNFNTYSSFVGALASCGTIVIAPEHRDQSAPVSFIKSSPDKPARPVMYRRYSHKPTTDVLNGRNAMLRVRMWELEKVYTAINSMATGRTFSNLADTVEQNMPIFKDRLDLSSGRVTWAGHSFGSATMVQFVKSVYYRQHAPSAPPPGTSEGWDWTPLYTPAENGELVAQITPESPMILLDLWTMPLTSKTTHWLWERPLPCYDRKSADGQYGSNVISIMSSEFFKWSQMTHRTKALLAARPVEAYKHLTEEIDEQEHADNEKKESELESPKLSLDMSKLDISKTPSGPVLDEIPSTSTTTHLNTQQATRPSIDASRDPSPDRTSDSPSSTPSPSSSVSSIHAPLPSTTSPSTKTSAPLLYHIPRSAHLSQSDFGVLFPNMTKYFFKTADPQETMDLNVRAAVAMLQNCGIDVRSLNGSDSKDTILESAAKGKEGRLEVLELPLM